MLMTWGTGWIVGLFGVFKKKKEKGGKKETQFKRLMKKENIYTYLKSETYLGWKAEQLEKG